MKDESNRKTAEKHKKSWQTPGIIAREDLESVAAVCVGPNAKGPGQIAQSGLPCGTGGSPTRS